MSSVRIKADLTLYNKWTLLGERITALRAIVQNDMNLTEQEINDWWIKSNGLYAELDTLLEDTTNYIKGIDKKLLKEHVR